MTRKLVLLGLIALGFFLSGIWTIQLPIGFQNTIGFFLDCIIPLDGIIPIAVLFACISWLIFLIIALSLYFLFKWIF